MKEFDELVEIMDTLRSPGGCPWDREQTHESIAYNLIEEAYEAVEAIENGDDESLKEELGDVLLQVVFHARMAAERGAFDIRDVVSGIASKLIARHPHVFGAERLETAEEVLRSWEKIKSEERKRGRKQRRGFADDAAVAEGEAEIEGVQESEGLEEVRGRKAAIESSPGDKPGAGTTGASRKAASREGAGTERAAGAEEVADIEAAAEIENSILSSFPFSMPAMLVALGLQKKAARLGYEFSDVMQVIDKIAEEAAELKEAARKARVADAAPEASSECARTIEHELGDLLFSVVNVARYLKINPEQALRKSSRRFAERIQLAERLAREQGRELTDLTEAELDVIWERAKELQQEADSAS